MQGKWEGYNLKVSRSQTPLGTCRPNPDYFGAVLFQRLMGTRVMEVNAEASNELRSWGHCTANASDLTLLLINLQNKTASIDLRKASSGAPTRTDYILTPGESPAVKEPSELLKTNVVNLNGQALLMGGNGDKLPPLTGYVVTGPTAVGRLNLPPLAVAFVIVHGAKACA